VKKRSRKLLVAAYVGIATLIGLEGAVRVWGYSQRHIYDPIYTSFDRTEDIPYVHKPNLADARARGLAVINTDSLGLRALVAGASYGPKQPNDYRVVVLGDSYTFGEGVARTEDTFPQVMEDILNSRRRTANVKVFNFGASAYSVKQMVATLEYRTTDIAPDFVVMAIIPSDFNLARTPRIDAEGYLIDQKLHQLSPPISFVRRALRQVHLVYVLREMAVQWFYPPADMGRVFSRGDIPDTYDYLKRFKDLAQQRRLPYVVALLPRTQGTWGRLTSRLKEDRVDFVDLSHVRSEFTKEQYMASPFDSHPSAAVHHRIGEALADYVEHQSGFPR
jgi:hypothetical protein